jgi:hypothetical protein
MFHVRREATEKVSVFAIKANRKSGFRVRDPKAEFIKRPLVTQSQETTVKAFRIPNSAMKTPSSNEWARVNQAALDPISLPIAVIDYDKGINGVNKSRRHFVSKLCAHSKVPSQNTNIDFGCNDLSICRARYSRWSANSFSRGR